MAQRKVLRETAIRFLEDDGVKLLLGGEFETLTGIVLGPMALFSLYYFSKENSFFFAMAASFFCLLTTFISGLLLFYIILSGKSEISVKIGERTFNNQWERYISKKSRENNNPT